MGDREEGCARREGRVLELGFNAGRQDLARAPASNCLVLCFAVGVRKM